MARGGTAGTNDDARRRCRVATTPTLATGASLVHARPDVPGGVKNPMRTARSFQLTCLALGLALLGSACTGLQRDTGGDGVRGGTLRVLTAEPEPTLDTAVFYYPPLARAYARTLYGYNLAGPPDQKTVPVPDIAAGPAQLSADRRTYTFRLRAGVRYAPPVDREVTAADFITAVQRLYDKQSPSFGQLYSDLIAGASRFGAGKATRISGLAAPDARTLTITLDQPAADFLSILTLAYFAPVPGEHAANYQVGANFDGHVVGTGPYTPTTYMPGETIVLDRNPNWDPTTDPLRKAWVDRIRVKLGISISSTRRTIEQEGADLSLISHVPQMRVAALRADPEQSRRLSVQPTGSLLYLVLGTHRAAGAIADVRVRQAVNYAIDKVAYRDALAGRFAASGELASTILAPGSLGYHPYDLYPTPGGRGDPAKARALLAEAGYPKGLTLGFATLGSGRLAAGRKPIEESLKKAGIRLKITTNREWDPHFEALGNPAKRLEHQLAQGGWIPDYLGDNARQTIVPQYDSRLTDSANFSEYDNPAVNRLIDRALAEADPARRAALWGQIDQRIMRDAPLVPLLWENSSFQWASRVHGWVYNPWTVGPDLTAVWLDPPSP
jgi:peptide/nickel transport system substrate-binding protein